MNAHLSDEQFTRYLGGSEDSAARAHLQECEVCGAEAQRLLAVVGGARAQAERATNRHPNFWALQRNEVRYALAIRRPSRPTWAIAAVMAGLVVVSSLLFQTQPPRPEKDGAAQVPPVTMSDDALLSAIDSTLAQDVPSALVPVQRLAYERERAERGKQN